MGRSYLQDWQLVIDNAQSSIESSAREELDNTVNLIDSKIQQPLLVSVSGAVLSVAASTLQRRKSDGSGGQSNSYKSLLSPVGAKTWVSIAASTIDVSSGSVTGDFASPAASYTMTASYYNWMGLSIRSDGKIYVTWGTQAATSGAAVKPTFVSSDYPIAVILVQDDGSSGAWNFASPAQSDINLLYGQGSGGGGSGSGLGSNLSDLPYVVEWEDSFADASLVNVSSGYTNAVLDLSKGAYEISYDSDTQAGWGVSGVGPVTTTRNANFTVAAGDVIAAVYTEVAGTAGAGLTVNLLTATTAIFTLAMVGRRVRNTTDATAAYIVSYVSGTQVYVDRAMSTWSGDALAVDSRPSVRKITTVTTQQSFTVESAFPANLNTSLIACISQAVHSKDIPLYYDSTDVESVPAALMANNIILAGVGGGATDTVTYSKQSREPIAGNIIHSLASGTWRETTVSSVTDAVTMVLANTTGMSNSDNFACITPQSFYLVNYSDSGLYGYPTVGYQAITGSDSASNWAGEYGRVRQNNVELTNQEQSLDTIANAGGHMFIRFYAQSLEGASNGSKTLYGYQSYWYRELVLRICQQAYGMTNNIGATNNVNMTISVSGGKTRITLPWGYVPSVSPGKPYGELEVRLNAQEIPRYVNATITPGAYYTEVSSLVIDLDQNYSAYAFEIGVVVRYGSVDSSNDNLTRIVALENALPTIQTFLSGSGTYTTPAGAKYLRVRMVGGGGGGGGSSGASAGGTGASGGSTTFGSSLLTANGGGPGVNSGPGGSGGSCAISSPATGFSVSGGLGSGGSTYGVAGDGGATPFGGAGSRNQSGSATGSAGVTNTGSGGGAGGTGTGNNSGSGGGAGGYLEAFIAPPSATYAYSVGTAGSGGAAGSGGGMAGAAGGSGMIIVEEYYV